MKNIKKFISFTLIFSMMVISLPLQVHATSESPITRNDFNGEKILDVYVENNDLYVVTGENVIVGSGKCPSTSKTISQTYTREELIRFRKDGEFENKVRSILAGTIASALGAGVAASVIIGIITAQYSGVAGDIQDILDNTTQSKITVYATFKCSDKVQSGGNWSHVWQLTGMKAK